MKDTRTACHSTPSAVLTPAEQDFLAGKIRLIPDFPKPGVLFRDITTLLGDVEGLGLLLSHLSRRYEGSGLNFIAGTESRGFIFAALLCASLRLPFVPLRKAGKLPAPVFSQSYELEYGQDALEIHQDAFRIAPGQPPPRVLLVDDLIATGGTAKASIKLIQRAGATVAEACFLINLRDLGGAASLAGLCPVYSLLEF